jgi:hypothetical protein|tara:strand:+ start:588 stop:1046 length:459 start_codon:yes stop_codon:yes gene_type:complete
MANEYCLKLVLLSLGVLGVWVVLNRKTEGFTNITNGNFPESLKNEFGLFPQSLQTALLHPGYKIKNNQQISFLNMKQQRKGEFRKLYPTFAVGSYKQKTNNKKCWTMPCNGTPSDICSGMNEKKQCENEMPLSPPIQNCRRVNYFCGISKNQ